MTRIFKTLTSRRLYCKFSSFSFIIFAFNFNPIRDIVKASQITDETLQQSLINPNSTVFEIMRPLFICVAFSPIVLLGNVALGYTAKTKISFAKLLTVCLCIYVIIFTFILNNIAEPSIPNYKQ